jgi:hypothetical protein
MPRERHSNNWGKQKEQKKKKPRAFLQPAADRTNFLFPWSKADEAHAASLGKARLLVVWERIQLELRRTRQEIGFAKNQASWPLKPLQKKYKGIYSEIFCC